MEKSAPQFLEGRIVSIIAKKTKSGKPYAIIKIKDQDIPITVFYDAEEILARYKRGDMFDAEAIYDDKYHSFKVQSIGASFYKGKKKKPENSDIGVFRASEEEKLKEFTAQEARGYILFISKHHNNLSYSFAKKDLRLMTESGVNLKVLNKVFIGYKYL